jgi:hypothetical protein
MGGVSKHTGFFSGILCLLFSFWGVGKVGYGQNLFSLLMHNMFQNSSIKARSKSQN